MRLVLAASLLIVPTLASADEPILPGLQNPPVYSDEVVDPAKIAKALAQPRVHQARVSQDTIEVEGQVPILRATYCAMGSGCDLASVGDFQGIPYYQLGDDGASASLIHSIIEKYGDKYETPILFTTVATVNTGGAYYLPYYSDVVGNRAMPFGYDLRSDVGSSRTGTLRGMVLMNLWWDCDVARYWWPQCSTQPPYDTRFFSLHGVLGQEVGHEWGAYLNVRDPTISGDSTEMLGRDNSHWNYFMDTGGSPMEGNHWLDNSDGSFSVQHADFVKYSDFDLYDMGVMAPREVQPWFLIKDPVPSDGNCGPYNCTVATPPEQGPLKVKGTRQDLTIDEVITANGPRVPSFQDAPRVTHELFVLVGKTDDPNLHPSAAVVERARKYWREYFYEATRTRMRAITTISGRDDYPRWEFTISSEGWDRVNGDSIASSVTGGAVAFLGQDNGAATGVENDQLEIDASQYKSLNFTLTAAKEDAVRKAQVDFATADGEFDMASGLSFNLVLDGQPHTYTFDLSKVPSFTGTIGKMRFLGALESTPTDRFSLDRIELTAEQVADQDGDHVPDAVDNCPTLANTDQLDADSNLIGDACQDDDGDGVPNALDNCPTVSNRDQKDTDANGKGDACQDSDGDGISDAQDACPATAGDCVKVHQSTCSSAGDPTPLALVAGLLLLARRRRTA